MSCHCRELRLQLALHVGQDDGALPEDLRRRVAVCPECRHHFRQLKTSISLLQTHGVDDGVELGKSLWPELSRRMPAKRVSRRWTDRASLAISVSAITVASIALFLVPLYELPQSGPVSTNPVSFPSQPMSFPAQPLSFPSQSLDMQRRSAAPMQGTPLKLFDRLLLEQDRQERERSGQLLFGPAYER